MTLSNSGGRSEIGLAAALDQFMIGSVAGDMVIRNMRTSGKVHMLGGGNTSAALTINNNNNVGIGTTSPSTTLDVNGGMKTVFRYGNENDTAGGSGWYIIGSVGTTGSSGRFKLSILSGVGYNMGTQGTETVITGSINNNNNTTQTNCSGTWSTVSGSPVISNVKFVQVTQNTTSTNRFLYAVYVNFSSSFTLHTVNADVRSPLIFTAQLTTTTDPGANSVYVEQATNYMVTGGLNLNGNIGIGTTTPGQALDVNGTVRVNNANTVNNKLLVLWDGGAADAVATACNFYGFGVNSGILRYQTTVTENHVFYQGVNPRMLIGSNIGIGTITPSQLLDVNGTSRTTNLITTALTGYMYGNGTSAVSASTTIPTTALTGTLGVANGGTGAATLTGYMIGNGTSAVSASTTIPTTALTGTLAVANGGTGVTTSTGTGSNVLSASPTFTGTVTVSGNGRFTSNVTIDNGNMAVPASGTSGGNGDRLILSPGGTGIFPYSIGMHTAQLWSSVPSGASNFWYVAGTAVMALSSSALTCTQDITAFGTVSDKKFKEDIVPLNTREYLDKTCALRPVSFRWKDDLFNETYKGQYDIGFIAQEVEEVVPEAVKDTEMNGDEFKTIKYERLIPLLVSSIKELKEENKKLQERVFHLETLTTA
jgi:hypothetical protein